MSPSLPETYRWIRQTLRFIVGAFFREIDVTGAETIPQNAGACGLIVSWHPNGLIDPGLIVTQFPHHVVFGARHGLFRYPILGRLMRQMGTVPIYRAIDLGRSDPDARRAANKKSLEALATRVSDGSFSALFPEGVSHDEPSLQELRSGAARLYYRARQLAAEHGRAPVIIPVGLHYDKKQSFRSNVLVGFHAPLDLPPELDVTPAADEDPDVASKRCSALTRYIETSLRDVVHATDDWPLHHLLHRLRRLIRAERARRADADPGKTSIGERVLGFARVRAGYYAAIEQQPEQVAALRERVEAYDGDLRTLGLEDYDLDRNPRLGTRWLAFLTALQFVLVFLLLPPIVVVGVVVNLPPALLLLGVARVASRQKKDVATVKLLFGAMLYPLTWIAAGVGAGFAHAALHDAIPSLPDAPITAGIVTGLLGATGGMFALRYTRLVRETARAIRVRLTRRRSWLSIAHLRVERGRIHDDAIALVEGVSLPGGVLRDGRVVASGGDPEPDDER
ncbi:MAG: 1-acyl-sn-glycerol-3-phosphate acyltransferase [Myxococcota bacterium]